ncbi:MAG: hypothetical protein FH758_07970 [Firmicutes bacterium]|nr:hypothetical protein [Bacillota bacterium]
MGILKIFKILNYLLGTAVVVASFCIYYVTKEIIPLYIGLAIITAGPLEDLLIAFIKKSPSFSSDDKELYSKIVDYATSLAFLVLLGLAVLKTIYT